jgi:hypothetical protein
MKPAAMRVSIRFVACVFAFGFSAGRYAAAAEAPVPQTIDFNRDIRPILSENCYFCHGPDKNKRKVDLRFDTHDGLFSTVKDHQTVVPGKPMESELFRRVTASDPDERMPDPKSNKRLSDRQIAVLKKWIEQGAPWKGHWAYLPPVRPAVPPSADSAFVKNPVDSFVLARLNEAGLHHAAEADRVTLIRRLSFDLTGLPPGESDVRAFVDDKSPDAYEKLVDRLLASPHYGERMAAWWLDLVRYADTIGYHSDNPMNVWPYRDFVIGAFNSNKHFDRFTREQLAGDLLPDANQETKVASAYNRLIETTEEGGAQAKEYAVKYECDRVRNVSTVWMAGTMGCCQCHDHKFDPYTQKDFYSMAAFFADVQEAPIGRREPGMPVMTDAQAAQSQKLQSHVAELKKQLEVDIPGLAEAQSKWEADQQGDSKVEWTTLTPASAKARSGSELKILPDGSVLGSKFAAKDNFVVTVRTELQGITGFRLEVLPDASLPAQGPGAAENGNFVLTELKAAAKEGGPIKFARATADHSQDGFPIASSIDGKRKAGWAILPAVGKAHEAIFEPAEPLAKAGTTTFTFTLEFQSAFPNHEIGHFRLSASTSPNPAGKQAIPEKVRAILAIAPDQRTSSQKTEVAAYYRTVAPLLAPARQGLETAEKEQEAFLNEVPKCLVSTTGTPRLTRLLHRGNWQDDSGDIESPAVPHFLPQPQVNKDRLTRLDLADWLVSRENPLTARVFVNRLCKMYLGNGVSKSIDDLGSQGESPTDPDPLDWLAVEFIDSGWDVKHMVRLIVTSGTYRQSSLAAPADVQADPFNRLYAHQSRFRLDAESVRDNALAISGLLSPKLGGPSVKPYQPAGYWDALNFPTRTYDADKGENQYRRGIYTWWQRTFAHPSLLAFDAPTREETTCERTQSNIPQQALVLLNDPTYVEAARVFAARILREGGSDSGARLTWAFQAALNRAPLPAEVEVLTGLYQKHLDEYRKDKDAAAKLLGVGDAEPPKDLDVPELAAWTSVARVILNLSETITRS